MVDPAFVRALVLLVVAACHPMLSAGYDMSPKVTGSMAPLMGQQMSGPSTAGGSYEVAIGGRIKTFSIELGIQAHDVSEASFSVPNPQSPTGPRYVAGTTSLDFGCDFLHWKHFAVNLHAGPALGGILDRMDGGTYLAQGMRAGAEVSASLGPLTAFVDASATYLAFGDGPATGTSELTGVTIGLSLR